MNITDKIKAAPIADTYMYVRTPLKIGDYVINFRYSSSEAGKIQQMLDQCNELSPMDMESMTRAIQVESTIAAKMENPHLNLVDAFYDKNEKQVVKLAMQTYKAYNHLCTNKVSDIKSLIEFWRVVCENCYTEIDVRKLGLRLYEKQSEIVDMPNMRTNPTVLNVLLDSMFGFLNTDQLISAIVKFIYLSLIEPFAVGNQRMAAMLFRYELGVDCLPIMSKLYWTFENYDQIFSTVAVSKSGVMDITETIELLLSYIKSAAEMYIRASKPFTKTQQLILAGMPLCEEVSLDKFKSMCATHMVNTEEILEKLQFNGYVVQEHKDYFTKIIDMK